MKAVIAWFDYWIDELVEAWLKTYASLGDYPDDRRTEREQK